MTDANKQKSNQTGSSQGNARGQMVADKSAATGKSVGSGQAAIKKAETKFDIPQQVKDKYADLVQLVLETESMNDEERQYWFHILPIMTSEQVEKFRKILLNEKEQLAKLDQEYEKEIKTLNDKHLVEWESMKMKEKKAARVKAETAHEDAETQHEKDLLSKINEI